MQLIEQESLPKFDIPAIQIERTKDKAHGDFACNIAMMLARSVKKNPRQIASLLVENLLEADFVTKVEIAGPGFINFTLSAEMAQEVVKSVMEQGQKYGRSKLGEGRSVQVEFVSANPTGPLHVGHGRGAAYGSVVSSLLLAVGFDVHREYYVNDAGRQMDILATSVWLRYLEVCGEKVAFPSNGYKGEYVLSIAKTLKDKYGRSLLKQTSTVYDAIPKDEPMGGDKEEHVDALIDKAKELLGPDAYKKVFDAGLDQILSEIRKDLADFGTEYDEWFSESSLMESGMVEKAIAELKEAEMLYQQDGAWWFKSTAFGDEKDRVVVRDNGQTTYFASDIAAQSRWVGHF